MRELDNKELNIVGGAGDPLTDPNSQIMRQIMAGAAQIPVMFRSQKFRWGQHGTVVKVKSCLGYKGQPAWRVRLLPGS